MKIIITMNQLRCKPGLWIALVLMLAWTHAGAQSYSHREAKKKSFPVSRETTVEIENKYGTILVVPWEKDSVQITAELYLEAKNQSKLRKLKNDVDVSFSATRFYILARTRIGDDNSRIASEIRALSNTLSNKSTVEINYTMYVPSYVGLVLSNKYGDIYIDDVDGDIDINLSNGVLKANDFNGNSTIELSFARGTVRNMGNNTTRLSYAELQVSNADQVDLVSKSSELQLDTVGVIKLDSRRDKLGFRQVEYLFGTTSFTDVNVTSFIRESDCYMKYGRLTIDHVLPGFSRINVESDYTDISLNFDRQCAYLLDVIYSDKAVLTLPEKNANISTRPQGEELFSAEGFVGSRNDRSKLNIKALNKCYIRISTR